MRNFQSCLIVKAKVSQRLPVFFNHLCRCGAEFLCHCTQRSLTRRKLWNITPTFVLDRFDQSRVTIFYTQELRVRLGSIMAILCCRGNGGNHFSFLARQHAVGGPHSFSKQRKLRCTNTLMGPYKSAHCWEEAEVIGILCAWWQCGTNGFFAGNRHPRFVCHNVLLSALCSGGVLYAKVGDVKRGGGRLIR